ncbi:hypothetical protein AB9F29_06100 [Falsihalocynthiibacter sp. S25ZX9]
MNDDSMNMQLLPEGLQVSVQAAILRIKAVPATTTLIEALSDDEWNHDSLADCNITAGGPNADELDDCDKVAMKVA